MRDRARGQLAGGREGPWHLVMGKGPSDPEWSCEDGPHGETEEARSRRHSQRVSPGRTPTHRPAPGGSAVPAKLPAPSPAPPSPAERERWRPPEAAGMRAAACGAGWAGGEEAELVKEEEEEAPRGWEVALASGRGVGSKSRPSPASPRPSCDLVPPHAGPPQPGWEPRGRTRAGGAAASQEGRRGAPGRAPC